MSTDSRGSPVEMSGRTPAKVPVMSETLEVRAEERVVASRM